jgi:hypothetical protein
MARSLLLLAACLAVLGCSKSNKATVYGTVTVDGEPAPVGFVSFFAVDGRAPTAGGPIRDGQYTAEVKPGVCKVQIRVPKEAGERKLYETPGSPTQKVWVESLPAKYNEKTELQFDVQPGSNEKSFDLKTK